VRYFRLRYPNYAGLLFAIPNGAKRTERQGKRLKDEGLTAGVADLCLAIPGEDGGVLFIEMKHGSNRQSKAQKEWADAVIDAGNLYEIINSFDGFKKLVDWHIRNYEQNTLQKAV
jgi:hypothetical protein